MASWWSSRSESRRLFFPAALDTFKFKVRSPTACSFAGSGFSCVSPVSYTRRGLCTNVLQEKRGTTQTTIYLAARSCLVRCCRLSSTMKSDPGSNDRIHSGHGRRRYRNERQGRTAATLLSRLKPPESPQLLCRITFPVWWRGRQAKPEWRTVQSCAVLPSQEYNGTFDFTLRFNQAQLATTHPFSCCRPVPLVLVMLTACRLRLAMKLYEHDQCSSWQVMLIFASPAGLMIPVSSGSELSGCLGPRPEDTWLRPSLLMAL